MKNFKLLLATTAILSTGALMVNAADHLTLHVGVIMETASEVILASESDKVDFGIISIVPSEMDNTSGTAEIKSSGIELSSGLYETGIIASPVVCTNWTSNVNMDPHLIFEQPSVTFNSMTFTPSIIDTTETEYEDWDPADGTAPYKSCYTIGGKLEGITPDPYTAGSTDWETSFTVTAVYEPYTNM